MSDMHSSGARARILARLRQGGIAPNPAPDPRASGNISAEADAAWLALQPEIPDLAARFIQEQEAVGARVRRVPDWAAVPGEVPAWLGSEGLGREGICRVVLGTEPRLTPLAEALRADGRFAVHAYDAPIEQAGDAVFGADCGITTALGGIAETGSLIVQPSPAEPRLLSLAPETHLAIVEAAALHPTLSAFVAGGAYQGADHIDPPTNLVLITGASRTGDIELMLTMGVHGPRTMLTLLVG